jgi:glyoxylase-like metal-dependent hydrolase (beta-lactamase superfamily II)
VRVTQLVADAGFVEVADGCFAARRSWVDVNVGLVVGERGVLVVDTHASHAAGARIAAEIAGLGLGEVVAVIATHEHWDHVFGARALLERWPGASFLAHETAAERIVPRGREVQRTYEGPFSDELRETELVEPTATFSSARIIDLGDRAVELLHPGRGHTGGDLVLRVPDSDAVFAGDLVEESAAPGVNADSFPLEWPATLDFLAEIIGADSAVIPGHGNVVDKAFVADQRAALGEIAENIRHLSTTAGSSPEDLEWPYPLASLRVGISAGIRQYGSARSLPLL